MCGRKVKRFLPSLGLLSPKNLKSYKMPYVVFFLKETFKDPITGPGTEQGLESLGFCNIRSSFDPPLGTQGPFTRSLHEDV